MGSSQAPAKSPPRSRARRRATSRRASSGVEIELWDGLGTIPPYDADRGTHPAPRPVDAGKPAAVMGATTGHFGAVWAQAELRKVLGSTGARVVDAEVALANADDAFDSHGRLNDEALRSALHDLVDAVAAEARRDRELALAA